MGGNLRSGLGQLLLLQQAVVRQPRLDAYGLPWGDRSAIQANGSPMIALYALGWYAVQRNRLQNAECVPGVSSGFFAVENACCESCLASKSKRLRTWDSELPCPRKMKLRPEVSPNDSKALTHLQTIADDRMTQSVFVFLLQPTLAPVSSHLGDQCAKGHCRACAQVWTCVARIRSCGV
jgi:hypothetical protein